MALDCMYLGGMTQVIDTQDIILCAIHRDDHYDYSYSCLQINTIMGPILRPGPTFRPLQISSPKWAHLSSNFVYVL